MQTRPKKGFLKECKHKYFIKMTNNSPANKIITESFSVWVLYGKIIRAQQIGQTTLLLSESCQNYLFGNDT